MAKLTTGIPGFDEMVEGGLNKGRGYLVIGGPGAGKTIFCVQFLLQGVKNNEKVLYVALEEDSDMLKRDMQSFGWDISRIKVLDTIKDISQGIWAIKAAERIRPEFDMKSLVLSLRKYIELYRPQRIVIDSLTSIKMLYDQEQVARRELLGFINFLETTGCTTLLTSELISDRENIMEEFLASGVIKLHKLSREGELISAISVSKLRGSNFDKHMRPFKIGDEGLTVFPNESVFG